MLAAIRLTKAINEAAEAVGMDASILLEGLIASLEEVKQRATSDDERDREYTRSMFSSHYKDYAKKRASPEWAAICAGKR